MNEEISQSILSFSPRLPSFFARKMKKSKNFAPSSSQKSREIATFSLSFSLSASHSTTTTSNHGECKKTHLSHFFLPSADA